MPEWKASWIWSAHEEPQANSYIYARKTFKLSGPPERATLYCCADSRYCVYVNGQFVGRGPVRYHVSAPYYDAYDVSALLRPGKNALAFLAHHIGAPTTIFMCARPGLLAQLDVLAGGEELTIASGGDWKVLRAKAYSPRAAKISPQLGFAEVFDARLAPEGWTAAQFDDSSWEDAQVVAPVGAEPWREMREREIPFLKESVVFPASVREVGEAAPPAEVDPLDPSAVATVIARSEHLGLGTEKIAQRTAMIFDDERATVFHPPTVGGGVYAVVDFERMVVGYPFVEVEAEPGAIIDLGYAESLIDGRVACDKRGVRCADRLIANGKRTRYEVFTPRACRLMHVEVRNTTKPVKIFRAGIRSSMYPAEQVGSFECSDDVLNQVWALGSYTTRLAMQDAFEGCPWHGAGQWMCDARVEALTAYYAFGETKLMRQCLRQMAAGQRDDGLTRAVYPAMGEHLVPDFTCMWVSALWEYYLHSGDLELVRELYPSVRRALAWFEDFKTAYGTLTNLPSSACEREEEAEPGAEVTARNCFYLAALRDAARLAGALGQGDDVYRFQDEADALAAAIRERLYDPERRVYADYRTEEGLSEQFGHLGNALALALGLVPEEHREELARQVIELSMTDTRRMTPHFSFCLMRALVAGGMAERAVEYIRQRLGILLDAGAKTIWEMWYPTEGRCHAWCGGPAYVLSAEVLGIKPQSPGFKTFAAKPTCFDLHWAKGCVPTPRGEVRISWSRLEEGDALDLWIVVPEGTVAQVGVPEPRPNFWETIDINESPAWRHGAMARGNPRVREAWVETGYVVFEVDPGTYTFQARA